MRPRNLFFALAGMAALGACDVDQTKEGDLPEVDVDINGGSLPEFNVQGPDVDVTTTETNITVPKIETEEKTVTVPDVDVNLPKD